MIKQDTVHYYGTISRFFHWVMAICFAFMLFTAIAWNVNEEYYSLMGYHKSVGVILMILIVLRILWAIVRRAHRPHEYLLAKLGHSVLYLLMLAIPTIGLLYQYGAARSPLEVFGVQIMAKSPEKIEWMMKLGNMAHGKLAWLLFVLIVGHIMMAIIHQVRGEKIINRMIG